MNSTAKIMLTCLAVIGLGSSAVAATNNDGGAGAPQGQQGQQGGPGPRGNRPGPGKVCRADVEKFCQGVQPGEGRIIACLKNNSSSLSSGCSEMLAKVRNRQDLEKGNKQGQKEHERDGEDQN